MSAESDPKVRVPTPRGTATGTVIDEAWEPQYNDQDRDMVRVDIDGTTLRVRADEVEEL